MTRRSYAQYCGVARALDIVGSRWSLLIVRELLLSPKRFGELLDGLPGIATNLLTERLRELEASGVLERTLDSRSNKVAYQLTPWGEELRETVAALVRWSTPLMVPGPGQDDFRDPWLVLALDAFLREHRSNHRVDVGFAVADVFLVARVGRSGTVIELSEECPDMTVLRCEPDVLLGLASGMLSVSHAVAAGELHGRKEDLEVLFNQGSRSEPDISPSQLRRVARAGA